jgi:uncharacterized protein involved in response to NO
MNSIDSAVPTSRPTSVLFAYAFRPFFLLAAIYALVLIGGWMGVWFFGWPLAGELPPMAWHAHEMLYGLVSAAIAGFLLTAMCNWTGAAPLAGRALAALVGLWLAGRLAMWTSAWLPAELIMAVDLAFLLVLAVYAGQVIIRSGNRRNLILVAVLAVLLVGNLITHLGLWWLGPDWIRRGELTGLFLIVLLMVIIGGRITPAFTRNWLVRHGRSPQVVHSWPWLEKLALGSAVLLVAAVIVGLPVGVVAALALLAGLVHGLRLIGWSGWRGWSDPLIWILHLGYAWVVVGLLLKGHTLFNPTLPDSVWLHALGVGAMGTLILGVMTRVSLGHTGRALILPAGAWLIYLAISLSALVRVLASAGLFEGRWPLWLAALGWVVAFALFLYHYTAILVSPRADGRTG